MNSVRRMLLAAAIGVPTGVGGFLLAERLLGWEGAASNGPAVASRGVPALGGPFQLTSHRGERVDEKTFRGKVQLLFFGFTNCPDVCPTALNLMSEMLDRLGQDGRDIQPLFVTVDPDRDTVEVLARYVEAFHPAIVALTGSGSEIDAIAKAYRVYYQKVPSSSGLGYVMDHTATIYVIDRNGAFRATLDLHQAPDDALNVLRRFAVPGS